MIIGKLLPAPLCALALSACGASTPLTRPLSIPAPPQQAPCRIPPVPRQADGSASSADMEQAVRDRGVAIAECEAKRAALVGAWPK